MGNRHRTTALEVRSLVDESIEKILIYSSNSAEPNHAAVLGIVIADLKQVKRLLAALEKAKPARRAADRHRWKKRTGLNFSASSIRLSRASSAAKSRCRVSDDDDCGAALGSGALAPPAAGARALQKFRGGTGARRG